MTDRGDPAYLRACTPADDPFIAVVFDTTWQDQVAALPNQGLAQHVLRIQHIAQERRFAELYPRMERHVVVWEGEPAGRLYVERSPDVLRIVDLTMLPTHRSQGIGARIVGDLCAGVRPGSRVTLRVARPDVRVASLARRLGFVAAAQDDVETLFEWVSADPPTGSASSHSTP